MVRCRSILGVLLLAAWAQPAVAGSHLWRFNEFYSSKNRKVQFIEMQEIGGSDGETAIAGHWYKTNTYNLDQSETLGSDLPFGTANKKFLVGTQSYAALPGVPAPDYVLPDGFLDPTGDIVHWWFYQVISIPSGAMPTDGIHSITVVNPSGPIYSVGVNSPTNFAGDTGTVVLGPPEIPLSPSWVTVFACLLLGAVAWWHVGPHASEVHREPRRGDSA